MILEFNYGLFLGNFNLVVLIYRNYLININKYMEWNILVEWKNKRMNDMIIFIYVFIFLWIVVF